VTGGYVCHGRSAPVLEGAYLFADYCSGRVWAMFREGEGFAEPIEVLRASFRVPSFGLDEVGEVYLLGFDGGIYRFTSAEPQPEPASTPLAPGATPPTAGATTPANGAAPTPTVPSSLPSTRSAGPVPILVTIVVFLTLGVGALYVARRGR
jgi:hypothetical protein